MAAGAKSCDGLALLFASTKSFHRAPGYVGNAFLPAGTNAPSKEDYVSGEEQSVSSKRMEFSLLASHIAG